MKGSMAVAHAVVGLACAGCVELASGDGWHSLLDAGLAQFDRLGDADWRVEQGMAVAGRGVGYLVSRKDYGDFELRAEFWAEPATNSGILIRCADRVKITPASCYEINIWDQRPEPRYGTGAIVDVAAVNPMPRAGGRWNTYVITARGDHLTVTLNGRKTADVHDGRHARGPVVLQQAQGAIQGSGGTIKFRKLEIRPL